MITNRQHWFHSRPTPLELKRKIEKSVVREAKDEEKKLKQVVKEMEETEKASHRAQKVNSEANLTFSTYMSTANTGGGQGKALSQ